MTDRHLILGPPGTGKTTRLLGIVEELLRGGTKPGRIAYLSFTRAAAQEAIERACARFELSPSDFPWFTTLHALAFRLKQLRSIDVMSDDQWDLFGEEYGWDFPSKGWERAKAKGNVLRQLYALSRARCEPIEKTTRRERSDFSPEVVTKFARQLRTYKETHGLLDYNDFLDNLDYALPVDVLIVDEAQDLTRQQWNLVQRLWRNVPRVYVAGDDDQAIYEWNGADPEAFTALEGTREVLPVSYRIGDNLAAVARAVVEPIAGRAPKVWRGREQNTRIDLLEPGSADFGEGEWLLLARTERQAWGLKKLAEATGRMWTLDGEGPHTSPAALAIVHYHRLAKGEALGPTQWGWVCRAIPGARLRSQEGGKAVRWGEVDWPFAGTPPWYEVMTGLSLSERTFFRSVLRRGERIDRPGALRVSTIHGAKGWESENVYLWNEGVKGDPLSDEERRVWYVGLTRAKSRIVIGGGRPSAVLRSLKLL